METEKSNTGGQNNYFQNFSFIKNYFLGLSFSNSKSDYRRITTNRKRFFWNSSSPKIKHETICKDFQYGGLKNIDIKSKKISL